MEIDDDENPQLATNMKVTTSHKIKSWRLEFAKLCGGDKNLLFVIFAIFCTDSRNFLNSASVLKASGLQQQMLTCKLTESDMRQESEEFITMWQTFLVSVTGKTPASSSSISQAKRVESLLFICDLCPNKNFKLKADLVRHIKGVHMKIKKICPVCKKSVDGHKSNFRRHLRSHKNLEPKKIEKIITKMFSK